MQNTKLFSLIRTRYNQLSETQKRVADFVLQNPGVVMYSSLSNFAMKLNVSETTILRFLRKLDYQSYQTFKVHVAQELSEETMDNLYEDITEKDNLEGIVNKVIASTVKSLQDSKESLDIKRLEELIEQILSAKTILIVGVGSSNAIAFDLYHKLLKLNLNCKYSSDSHISNIICNSLTEKDLLIAISHSGESMEIINSVNLAKRNGSVICSITSYESSTLVSKSNITLLSSSLEMHFRSDALTSRIIQMVFIDMIYISLAIRMGAEGLRCIENSREAVALNKR